jgi:RNA polymerase sigma-70 factor, ECF subfamily
LQLCRNHKSQAGITNKFDLILTVETTQTAEERLIELIHNRNPKCVSVLYDAYSRALYGIILHIVQNRELAEEVLQDTFTKAWRNIDRYDTRKGRLYTWLVNIARNSAIDATRAKHFNRRNVPIESTLNLIDAHQNKSINTDTIGVQKLIEALPKNYKILIDLIYFQGFTQAETAEYLSMPIGTVKTHLRVAMTLLKQLF